MKKTKAEKREEEARIIAEMDEALQQAKAEKEEGEKPKVKRKPIEDEDMPKKLHCKRCKTLMENGVCPTCGFTVYIPMDKEKRNKIKLVLTAVAMAIFVVVFVITQIVG